jgi:hypothetical protein
MVAETTNFPGSSNLASASYDPETQVLTIEFRSGGVYEYTSVPPEMYQGLQRAPSAGKYWNHHKDSYNYQEV